MEDKQAFKCNNCGSNSYHNIDSKTVECDYCHTKYRIKSKPASASIKAGNFEAGINLGDVGDKVKSYVEEKPSRTAKIIYAVSGIAFGTFGVQHYMMGKNWSIYMFNHFLLDGYPIYSRSNSRHYGFIDG